MAMATAMIMTNLILLVGGWIIRGETVGATSTQTGNIIGHGIFKTSSLYEMQRVRMISGVLLLCH